MVSKTNPNSFNSQSPKNCDTVLWEKYVQPLHPVTYSNSNSPKMFYVVNVTFGKLQYHVKVILRTG